MYVSGKGESERDEQKGKRVIEDRGMEKEEKEREERDRERERKRRRDMKRDKNKQIVGE